jgi:cyclomaltodextrinase / maltogenic alpha-amylase / neopullulanase
MGRSSSSSIRSALVAALVVAATACTTSEPASDTDPASTSPTSSEEEPLVRWSTTGGDVFAWQQRVSGEGECDEVVLLVDGERSRATARLDGDVFSAVVPVRTGANTVVARCRLSDGSVEQSETLELRGMLEPRPKAWIDVSVQGADVVLDGSRSEPTEHLGTPVRSWTWFAGDTPAPVTVAAGGRSGPFRGEVDGKRIVVTPPRVDGQYDVTLEVRDRQGRSDRSTTYFVVENGTPRAVDMAREHPAWIDRAVVYAPIAQLWGDNGFKTVEQRLPYLADLGVDALWLWPPVTRRAPGEEYAIADYFTIDDEWGPAADLRRLVLEAHRLDMRVLLDFVPNHSSDAHRYFRAAERDGEASHYWDFYDRTRDGTPTHYFDWTNLPNLNYDNPQVRRMMTEAFAYWVREFDVDGFRVDAAWAIERRRPSYWPEWRRELKRIKADLFLLGEAPAYDGYYFHNGFDAAFDWSGSVGHWAWTGAFDEPQVAAEWLNRALTNNGKGYDPKALILRFLNNNDTGARFVDKYSADIQRLASALEFTVAGVPLMFAGDEIGASYEPYSTLHRIPWKDRFELRPWYDSLIRLRHTVPALWSNRMTLLDPQNIAVVAYVRPAADGGDAVLVLINFGRGAPLTIVSDPALDPFGGSSFRDLLGGGEVPVSRARNGDLSLRIPAKTAFVLTPGTGRT